MIKLLGVNSICLIGKLSDIKLQLTSIQNKNLTLAEYIQEQSTLYKKTLN